MLKIAILLVCVFVPLINSRDPDCVYPGICTPPTAKYSRVIPTAPRYQWLISGGFCGSVSVQTGLLSQGAWVSQDLIRKATLSAGPGEHGNPTDGYEICPNNINSTFGPLKFEFDQWNWNNTQPQSPQFLKWMKSHLVQGHPLVIFVMEKGSTHNAYNMGYYYDHVEPVFAVYSNHELTDETVYDDDWFTMASDYAPDGQANLGYFRTFNSYPDTFQMDNNCKDAQAGWGKDEMYPCIYDQINYGNAILGPVDPKGLAVPTSLDIHSISEPNVRQGETPDEFKGTVTVTGLKSGANYIIYRYDNHNDVPVDSDYANSQFAKQVKFTASGETHVYEDPVSIISSGATYYRTVPAETLFMQ